MLRVCIKGRTASPWHRCQQASGVGEQSPGASRASHRQKQQRQEQSFYHRQIEREAAGGCRGRYTLNRGPKLGEEPCLIGCRKPQQASYPLLPHWLRHYSFFLDLPFHGAVTPSSARTRLICPRLTSRPNCAWSSALTWLE